MSIQFHCPHCDKLLTTSDDKAGARAKCPGCSEVVTVPAASGDEAALPEAPVPPLSGSSRTKASRPSGSSGGEGERKPCPMCGELILSQATKCRYCGEVLVDDDIAGGDRFKPTQVEVGEIFDVSWKVFQKNIGICVAMTLIVGFVPAVLMGLPMGVLGALADNRAISPEILPVFMIPLMLVGYSLILFLMIGQTRMMIRMARGESVQISELFQGGSCFFPALGALILFGLMYMVGAMMCLIPGLIVLMMFWPYLHLIVDRNVGVLESFSLAKTITKGNFGTTFLMGLIAFGLQILGVVACYVGMLFTTPLIVLMFAVGYLKMSGQRTARV